MKSSGLSLKPIGFRTKQEMIFQNLRDGIMTLSLVPGQRLIIEEIAKNLGVSTIPVREALQLLQAEYLVTIEPHVGAVVSPISPDSVEEVFTLLEALEISAVRIVINKMNDVDDQDLLTLTLQMDKALNSKNIEVWAELNKQFHQRICKITAMPTVIEMTDRVLNLWDRVRRYFFPHILVERFQEAHRQHRSFLKALKDRNLQQAEELIRMHNRNALKQYLKELRIILNKESTPSS
jgi:DNA-binding GntR family transcriptional regulator